MRILSILFLSSIYTAAAGRLLSTTTTTPATTTTSTSVGGACPYNGGSGGSISVSGVGTATSTPDMATINAGVTTKATTAQDALAANNEVMSKIMDVLLTEYNIEEKNVQTIGFNLYPEYEYPRDGITSRILIGYSVSNRLNVQVLNLDELGSILDSLVTAGSNDMSGIQFGFSDIKTIQNEARQNAIKDAQEKAKLYVTATADSNVELGSILSISEPGTTTPLNTRFDGREFAMDSMSGSSAVPVSVGENEISATVHMVFALTTTPSSE